jgi:hypothetical protein
MTTDDAGFQEVPLFDVPPTHERTPLPAVRVTVSVDVEIDLPGELLRGAWLPNDGGPVAIASTVMSYLLDADALYDDVSDYVGDAARKGCWEIVEITTVDPCEGWSWERFAAEVQHPTWRPIGGDQ